MEEIKDVKNAWEGDVIEYKNKTYRVVAVYYDTGFRILKVVSTYPRFWFTRVLDIPTGESCGC